MRLLPIVLLAAVLGGCGAPTAEDEVAAVVGKYVKAIKNSDGEDLCKLLAGRPLAEARAGGLCDREPEGVRGFAAPVKVDDVRITGGRAEASLVQGRSLAAIGLVERDDYWYIDRVELVRSELRVPDASLEPDLAQGYIVVVDATAYDDAPPRPGDIVAVEDPEPVLRRVERVAGESVRLEGGTEVATGDVIGRADAENASPAGG